MTLRFFSLGNSKVELKWDMQTHISNLGLTWFLPFVLYVKYIVNFKFSTPPYLQFQNRKVFTSDGLMNSHSQKIHAQRQFLALHRITFHLSYGRCEFLFMPNSHMLTNFKGNHAENYKIFTQNY